MQENMWKNVTYGVWVTGCTSLISQNVASHLHFQWLAEMYRLYCGSEWKRKIPSPENISGEAHIMWNEGTYCLLHERHKFGQNVFEVADPKSPKSFAFFDYKVLPGVFDGLDSNSTNFSPAPYIPTHYAFPTDRWDFQNNLQKGWDENSEGVFLYSKR